MQTSLNQLICKTLLLFRRKFIVIKLIHLSKKAESNGLRLIELR